MNPNKRGWRVSPWRAYLDPTPNTHHDGSTPDPDVDIGTAYVRGLVVDPGHVAATVSPHHSHGARVYRGARVVDDEIGVTYEVAAERVDGKPRIVVITVVPHHGREFTARTPLPVAALARIALKQVEDGLYLHHSMERGADNRASLAPDLAEVARIYRQVRDDGGSPRQELHRIYRRPMGTIDKWIQRARKQNHLNADDLDPRGRKPRPTQETK